MDFLVQDITPAKVTVSDVSRWWKLCQSGETMTTEEIALYASCCYWLGYLRFHKESEPTVEEVMQRGRETQYQFLPKTRS